MEKSRIVETLTSKSCKIVLTQNNHLSRCGVKGFFLIYFLCFVTLFQIIYKEKSLWLFHPLNQIMAMHLQRNPGIYKVEYEDKCACDCVMSESHKKKREQTRQALKKW